jgi:hypothetical protein
MLIGSLLVTFRGWLRHPLELPWSRSSDLIRHYLPFKETLYRLYQATGSIPRWDPHGLGGHPLAADPGYGAWYPLGLPFYLMPPDHLFVPFFLAHVALGALLMYRLLRRHGVSPEAATLGTMAYSLNLKLLTSLYAGFATMVPAQAWLPGAFLAAQRYKQATSRREGLLAIGGLGAALALQLLAGDAQLMLYTVLLVIPYTLYVPAGGLEPAGSKRRGLLAVALASMLALLFSLPQLVPTAALTPETTRSHGLSEAVATLMSLPPSHLPAMVIPALSGSDIDLTYRGPGSFWEMSFYPGLPAWLLLVLAVMGCRTDRRILPLALLSYLTLLLCFGRYTPVYPLLYHLAPGFDHFRGPARALPVLALFVSLLAAIGLDAATRADADRERRRLQWLCAALVAGCGVAVVYLLEHRASLIIAFQGQLRALIDAPRGGQDSYDALLQGIGFAGLTALVFVGALAWLPYDRGGSRRFRTIVVGLAAFDLVNAADGLLETRPLDEVLPPHPLAQQLARETRIDVGSGALGGAGASGGRRPDGGSGPPEGGDERAGGGPAGRSGPSDGSGGSTGSAATGGLAELEPHQRILDLSGALPDAVAAHYGLELVNGMNPLVLRRPYLFGRFLQDEPAEVPADRTVYGLLAQTLMHPRLLDLLRVSRVVTAEGGSIPGYEIQPPVAGVSVFQQFRGLARYPALYVHARVAALPVAWVVTTVEPQPEKPGAALERLETVDPFQGALVDGIDADGGPLRALLGAVPDRTLETFAAQTSVIPADRVAAIEAWRPDDLTLSARAPADGGVLVLSEIYTDRWRVEVDGRPAHPLRADFLLRAVQLPPGTHRVRWWVP